MLRKSLLSVWIAVFLVPAFAQQETQSHFDGKIWWDHIKVWPPTTWKGAKREAQD